MTLIVGVKTATVLQLISDSKISHPDETQEEETPGRLKLVALSPHICVGYAGRVAPALDRLRSISNERRGSFESVIEDVQTVADCDFVIADSATFRQVAIVNGLAHEDDIVHIGDGDAWAALQAERPKIPAIVMADPGPNDADISLISNVLGAFERILVNPAHPTVGGFKIRVSSRADGFRYMTEAAFAYNNISGPLNESTAERYASAAAGGYAYTVLVPSNPGEAVIAIHISPGQIGFVHAPLITDKPIVVSDVDESALVEFVKVKFGINLVGLRRTGATTVRTPS